MFASYNLDTMTMKKQKSHTMPLIPVLGSLNARLLKLECGELAFPLPSTHNGHVLKSTVDMHSYKPMPEVIARVQSLVSDSYLSQIILKLSLKKWVTKELIPEHI